MKTVTEFVNRYFPNIADRIWVDLFCGVALLRFARGLSIDATTLGVILGTYVFHQITAAKARTSEKLEESADA